MGRLDAALQYAAHQPQRCKNCKQVLPLEDFSPKAVTCRACNTAYHRRHRQENPAAYRQADKRYARTHPVRWAEKNKLRRDREAQAPGRMLQTDWYALCSWADYRCLACGADVPLYPDHVIPLTAGGSHDLENRQPLCRSCNSQKGVGRTDYRDPESFAAFLAERSQKKAA